MQSGATMARLLRNTLCLMAVLALAGCETNEKNFPEFEFTGKPPEGVSKIVEGVSGAVGGVANSVEKMFEDEPPVIRQPVLPEMLVACRGHVFVPALGMRFVKKGKPPPTEGQYVREERLTPPYRIIPFGANVSVEQSPKRLNVELDRLNRVIGLFCG
jgi:hypothetical protein